jgi:MFS transporter, ACS family, glucarate transporter
LKQRHQVLFLLSLLSAITYLDRVCISVAGPRIQHAFHLSPVQWGWVGGVFSISYALFEIPSGYLGDWIGARAVLSRIVLWWSGFTALTGLAWNYPSLLITRFLFGVGEAGAGPNASISISRWFPPTERARAMGIFLMGGRSRDCVDAAACDSDSAALWLEGFLLRARIDWCRLGRCLETSVSRQPY